MSRTPRTWATVAFQLGGGSDGWASIDLDSIKFRVETERSPGRTTVETLSRIELQRRYPRAAAQLAQVIFDATRPGWLPLP